MVLIPRGSGSKIGGGSSKGYPTADVSNIQISTGQLSVKLKWKDPNDTILDNAKLAEWYSTIVVRKENEVPETIKDGVQIVESTVRNQYQNEFYIDSNNIVAETTYYYRFFTKSKLGVISNSSPTVKIQAVEISDTLSDNSWETIISVAESGQAGQYWQIGDKKDITLIGEPGKTITVKIIGINKDFSNKELTKTNGITFMVDKLYDSYHFSENDRTTISCAGSGSGFFRSYFNILPDVIKKGIKTTYKNYIDGTISPGHVNPGTNYSEKTLGCKLFVPTCRDMNFDSVYDLEYSETYKEKNQPYSLFTNNASRIMKDEAQGKAKEYAVFECPYSDPNGTGGGSWEYTQFYTEENGSLWHLGLGDPYKDLFVPVCFCL